jgi:hypothetical protein
MRNTLRVFKIAVLMMLVGITSQSIQAQFLHPKVKSKETKIRRIVILPAKVSVVRDSMKGPEGMAAESDELSLRVEEKIAEVLSKQKNVSTLPRSSDAADSQKYDFADFQTKFDALLPTIVKKRSDVKKGRFSMGDEVLNLNLSKSADAIVFIRGEGKKLTSGKTAFHVFVGGMPAYLKLQIGMVDTRSGDVLLYTDPILVGDPTTAVDRLRKMLEKGFKKLPSAGAP